jgi:hypothetical protein
MATRHDNPFGPTNFLFRADALAVLQAQSLAVALIRCN